MISWPIPSSNLASAAQGVKMSLMENVEFNPDEQNFASNMVRRAEKPRGGVAGTVGRLFGTKDDFRLNVIMIMIAVFFFFLSAVVIFLF